MQKMIKKIFTGMLAVSMLTLGLALFYPMVSPASAYTCPNGNVVENPADCNDIEQPTDLGVVIKRIVNVALYVVGAVSVLMLVYGGFRYVVSGGDANAVATAKNTILYAIVGVVIAILSYAIVNFVVSSILGT
jgi:hypothetical protein